MKLVTVISDLDNFGYKKVLKPSTLANKLNLDVIYVENYSSHRVKDQLLLKYLYELDINEIVFCTDGYDTVFLTNAEEIISKYCRIGKELLFAAEIVCWPDTNLIRKYPKNPSPYRFLNAGGFIGRAGYIKDRIEENLQTESIIKYYWSNQIYWTEQYLKHFDEIGIDSNCEIFCTMVSNEDINTGQEFLKSVSSVNNDSSFYDYNELVNYHSEIEHFDSKQYYSLKLEWFKKKFKMVNDRIFVNQTQNYPCHVHFNGKSDVLVPHVIRKNYKAPF